MSEILQGQTTGRMAQMQQEAFHKAAKHSTAGHENNLQTGPTSTKRWSPHTELHLSDRLPKLSGTVGITGKMVVSIIASTPKMYGGGGDRILFDLKICCTFFKGM